MLRYSPSRFQHCSIRRFSQKKYRLSCYLSCTSWQSHCSTAMWLGSSFLPFLNPRIYLVPQLLVVCTQRVAEGVLGIFNSAQSWCSQSETGREDWDISVFPTCLNIYCCCKQLRLAGLVQCHLFLHCLDLLVKKLRWSEGSETFLSF